MKTQYRGRLAPTPSGYLHVGHASTFWTVQERAKLHNGDLILRVEDLDQQRCKPEFVDAMFEDFKWLGLTWNEGPNKNGKNAPYSQSERLNFYLEAWQKLLQASVIYPSPHSRKDVESALVAPHAGDKEIIFPIELRPNQSVDKSIDEPGNCNWRFRVPDGKEILFNDKRLGEIKYDAGEDFGDFLVWRKDGYPSYELAVVVDDVKMEITEVVRGEDLLLSTARQLLIYNALGMNPPDFYHCPLIRDENGKRYAKREGALSLKTLREQGLSRDDVREKIFGVKLVLP